MLATQESIRGLSDEGFQRYTERKVQDVALAYRQDTEVARRQMRRETGRQWQNDLDHHVRGPGGQMRPWHLREADRAMGMNWNVQNGPGQTGISYIPRRTSLRAMEVEAVMNRVRQIRRGAASSGDQDGQGQVHARIEDGTTGKVEASVGRAVQNRVEAEPGDRMRNTWNSGARERHPTPDQAQAGRGRRVTSVIYMYGSVGNHMLQFAAEHRQ